MNIFYCVINCAAPGITWITSTVTYSFVWRYNLGIYSLLLCYWFYNSTADVACCEAFCWTLLHLLSFFHTRFGRVHRDLSYPYGCSIILLQLSVSFYSLLVKEADLLCIVLWPYWRLPAKTISFLSCKRDSLFYCRCVCVAFSWLAKILENVWQFIPRLPFYFFF